MNIDRDRRWREIQKLMVGRVAMREDPDWRALFLKYAAAVVADDYIVGLRCLEPRAAGLRKSKR